MAVRDALGLAVAGIQIDLAKSGCKHTPSQKKKTEHAIGVATIKIHTSHRNQGMKQVKDQDTVETMSVEAMNAFSWQ